MTPLGRIGLDARDAVAPLVKLIRGDDRDARDAAAQALSTIGHVAVPTLVELLRDPYRRTRRAAREALLRMGRDAVPAILELLRSEDPDVHSAAAAILKQINNQTK
jgi:HEAT repeat protein